MWKRRMQRIKLSVLAVCRHEQLRTRQDGDWIMKAPIVLSVFYLLIAGPAFAGGYSGTCTTAAKDQWMTEEAAKAKVTEAGYTVTGIKITRSSNCYEAYVTDKTGKKMELFLDPTTAKVVHSQ
jgi:hypothetical protein